ncbi:hypothetical protein QBC32DRAFT_206080, partial [Pseudoneurospora amorphoporcata]
QTLTSGPGLSTTTSLPSILPTLSTNQVDGAISSEGEKKTSSGGRNKGAIIGGHIAGLVVIGAIVFFFWRKRKNNRKRHSASSISHLSTSKNAGKLSDKDCYPDDDSSSSTSNTIGRTSPWPIKGATTVTNNSVRQPVSGAGAICPRPGHNPVSPMSLGGDAASLGGHSSISRGSSFSSASDDYSCRGSSASNVGSIYQATALAYPTPGRATPIMSGAAYPATARVVHLSPKAQKPEIVMVRNNRNSSTAELLSLSRNPSRSAAGISGKRASQWDKEACGTSISSFVVEAGYMDETAVAVVHGKEFGGIICVCTFADCGDTDDGG